MRLGNMVWATSLGNPAVVAQSLHTSEKFWPWTWKAPISHGRSLPGKDSDASLRALSLWGPLTTLQLVAGQLHDEKLPDETRPGGPDHLLRLGRVAPNA